MHLTPGVVHNFPNAVGVKDSFPYVLKGPRFLFEKRGGQPQEFWSLISKMDGSTLPQKFFFFFFFVFFYGSSSALHRWSSTQILFRPLGYPQVWNNSYAVHEVTGKTHNQNENLKRYIERHRLYSKTPVNYTKSLLITVSIMSVLVLNCGFSNRLHGFHLS